jgi:hypothetical protein
MAGGAIAVAGSSRASQYQGKTTFAVVSADIVFHDQNMCMKRARGCGSLPVELRAAAVVFRQVMIAIVAASGGLLFG